MTTPKLSDRLYIGWSNENTPALLDENNNVVVLFPASPMQTEAARYFADMRSHDARERELAEARVLIGLTRDFLQALAEFQHDPFGQVESAKVASTERALREAIGERDAR